MEEEKMSTALTQYAGAGGELMQWRRPEEVLAEAQQAATALVKVIEMKKNKVVFNNETYLEFEDWQTVAKFYGCTAKVISTKYVEFGEVHGFEAEAVVLDRNQSEIGRSESMCLSDEENWGMVPKYEWQDVLDNDGKKIWDARLRNGKGGYKATKVQVGATAKPLFQLRSMAQTRASAKALRSIFAWVVVLAGYKPTPAEEMTGHEFDNEPEPRPQVSMPKSTDEKKAEPPKAAPQAAKAETVKQNPPAAQQGAAQGQPKAEEISGEIEKVSPGKGAQEGTLWLVVNKKVICVPANLIDAEMCVGAKILIMAVELKGGEIKKYLAVSVEIVVPPAQEGEIIDAEVSEPETKHEPGTPDPVLEEARAAGLGGIFDDAPRKAASKENPGTPDRAPTGEATKPGTIGIKRAKRIYAIIGQNHKNTNFTEAELKRFLSALPAPLEHLRDLEIGMYEQVEKWATGEEDFQDFWRD
jgi:hypothetical protein